MKRKRLLALLLTGIMTTTLLAGCGGSGEEETTKEADANGDKTTITIWTKDRHDANYIQEKVDAYNESNTDNVVVEYLKKQDQGHIHDPSRCVVKLRRAKPVRCIGQVHDMRPDTSRFRRHDHGRNGEDTGCKDDRYDIARVYRDRKRGLHGCRIYPSIKLSGICYRDLPLSGL